MFRCVAKIAAVGFAFFHLSSTAVGQTTAPNCSVQSLSGAECQHRIERSSCVKTLVKEVAEDVSRRAEYTGLYPVCDDNDSGGWVLLGWCPCNGAPGSGYYPNWIESTPPRGDGGFTIDAHPLFIRQGKSISFSASCGVAGPYTVSWDFGDGNIGSGGLVNHAFGTQGGYHVQATCRRSDGGATKAASLTVSIVDFDIKIPAN